MVRKIFPLLLLFVEELSHEIEMGCWWYGWIMPCLERYCTEVAPAYVIEAISCKCAVGCWQPSGKFVTRGKRVLASFWQIFCIWCQRLLGNLLTNSPESIDNFCK
jgi:hypothetical protein